MTFFIHLFPSSPSNIRRFRIFRTLEWQRHTPNKERIRAVQVKQLQNFNCKHLTDHSSLLLIIYLVVGAINIIFVNYLWQSIYLVCTFGSIGSAHNVQKHICVCSLPPSRVVTGHGHLRSLAMSPFEIINNFLSAFNSKYIPILHYFQDLVKMWDTAQNHKIFLSHLYWTPPDADDPMRTSQTHWHDKAACIKPESQLAWCMLQPR